MSEQVQQYCCWYFENCIKFNQIITKDKAFPEHARWINQEEFKMHPKYLLWNEHKDPSLSGWHWFHFCSNCGFKYSTDEQIVYWNNRYNNLLETT